MKEPSTFPRLQELLQQLTPDVLDYLVPGYSSVEEDIVYSCSEPELEDDGPLFSMVKDDRKAPLPKVRFSKVQQPVDEDAIAPRTVAILKKWEELEKEFGITIEDLYLILGYRVKLSRLRITDDAKIYLTDYDGREVRMNDLTKAVYFFYLRHPEGARLADLRSHEKEILDCYLEITGRDDYNEILSTVHNLLDPSGNDLNVCFSRIRRAFRNVVEERVASRYYISGHAGEVYKVLLDRDFVIWDY